MKKSSINSAKSEYITFSGSAPLLCIAKLGLVSRDYNKLYENGYRDFSNSLAEVLQVLDDNGCDAVLFSFSSIIPRVDFQVISLLKNLKNINVVFLEEFEEKEKISAKNEKQIERENKRFVVYYCNKNSGEWSRYIFNQQFSTLTRQPIEKILSFVKNELPRRILGNCLVLLCGETNGVKYSKKRNCVEDKTYGLRKAIPKEATIILNPIHDRMTRFEMKLKRSFLSENDRWIISVWNKGRKDRNGKKRDGLQPPWTVYHNGEEKKVALIDNELGVDMGCLDFADHSHGFCV